MKPFFAVDQKIIAHSGGIPGMPGVHPDTIKKALDIGADIIYIQAVCTKDDRIVISESDEVVTGDDTGAKISELTYNELINLCNDNSITKDKDTFTKFYLFTDILTMFPEQHFIVEFNDKRNKAIRSFCQTVESSQALDRIMIYSLFEKPLKKISRILPNVAKAVSLYGLLGIYALFRAGLLYFKRRFKSDAVLIPESIGMSYIGNSGFIRECRLKGMRVYVYTDNKKQQIERLYEIGIHGFITRDVASAKKIIDELRLQESDTD